MIFHSGGREGGGGGVTQTLFNSPRDEQNNSITDRRRERRCYVGLHEQLLSQLPEGAGRGIFTRTHFFPEAVMEITIPSPDRLLRGGGGVVYHEQPSDSRREGLKLDINLQGFYPLA